MTFIDVLLIIATVLGALLLFGLTVFAHELGHFIGAKWMGLYVDRFAVGMGPTLWSFKLGETEYCVKWLPVGGFVSIPQMAPMEAIEGKVENLPKNLPAGKPLAKIVAAFFGPLFSLLFGLALAVVIFFVGKNLNTTTLTTTIGYVARDTPAYEAGLRPGDKIISVNGARVTRWLGGADGVYESILLSTNRDVDLAVERDGQRLDFKVECREDPDPRHEKLRTAGFEEYRAKPLIIERLTGKDSPAALAGLRRGDVITRLDGQRLYCPAQFKFLLDEKSGAFTLELERDGAPLTVTLEKQRIASDLGEYTGIGVQWQTDFYTVIYPSPLAQVSDSLVAMWRTIVALVSPDSGVGMKHLSGPVGIFDIIIRMFLSADFRALLAFWVFFNVNLAVLNLLPLPVLDGGHIMFALFELVARRPLHIKVINALMVGSLALLLAFFALVTFYDSGRIWRNIKGERKAAPVKESVQTAE
ncbi:MAG: RIP metalloprotease RseP [Verrucomicrobiales bacterium]|jgi:regulator of sigma E protease|nr:RIP metalloprotease RseP [Verrucomicrobiales bacterium]